MHTNVHFVSTENEKLMCINWKNELIPSEQEFIPSQKYCQICMCDDNIATDCRNITCDLSKCTENLSSPCCTECIKSSNTTQSSKSEVQNDAINSNTNRVVKETNNVDKETNNVDSFDHTTNHVEGNKVETVSNYSSVEEKDEAHKVSKEEKISNQNITEEKENVTTLMENVTSVAVTGTTEQVTGTSFTQHFCTAHSVLDLTYPKAQF